MIDTELSEYVTVQEACRIVGVSRTSLDNYARSGVLTRYQKSAPKRMLYKRSELNLLLRVRPKYQ